MELLLLGYGEWLFEMTLASAWRLIVDVPLTCCAMEDDQLTDRDERN